MRWILPLILLTAVHAQLPPSPPGAILIPPKPVSPKFAEQIQSWGAPMRSTPSFAPKVVTLPGFTITNLAVTGGQVTLQWKEGVPPFQVIGEPTLYGPWNDVGNPTTARSKTFPEDINHFFTVQGSIVMPLEATQTNNLTRLTWEAPDTAMSDSLQAFTLKRSTDNGATFPNTVAVVQPGQPYSVDDTTAIPPGGSLTWELLEQTLNGVVVPYSKPKASNVAPGTTQWANGYGSAGIVVGISSGFDYGYATCSDSSGNIYLTGTTGETVQYFGGPNLGSHGAYCLFMAKYDPAGHHLISRGFGVGLAGSNSLNSTAKGFGIAVRGNKVVVVGLFTTGATGIFDFGGTATAGQYFTALGATDGFVAQYTDTGTTFTLDWVRRIGSSTLDGLTIFGGNQVSAGVNAVAIDASGNVWCTGSFNLDVDFGDQVLTANPGNAFLWKLNGANGTTIFSKQLSGGRPSDPPNRGGGPPGNGSSIALDSTGKPIITGSFCGPPNYPLNLGNGITLLSIPLQNSIDPLNEASTDMFAAKFDTSGVCQWAISHGGQSLDVGLGVAIDKRINPLTSLPYDDVVVCGAVESPASVGGPTATLTTSSGGFVAKYSGTTGAHKWSSIFGIGPLPSGGSIPALTGLAIDSNGNIITIGFSQISSGVVLQFSDGPHTILSSGNGAIFIAKWTPDGNAGVGVPLWARGFINTGGLFGLPASGLAVTVGPDNAPVGTGYYWGSDVNGHYGNLTFDGITVQNYFLSDVWLAKFSP